MLKSNSIKWFFASITFFFCLGIYYYNLAPGITLEDSGEFLTALKFSGTPHPPGYPLYSIIGSFWVNLLSTSTAFMGNLFSAICMASSCLVYYFILLLLNPYIYHSKSKIFEYFFAFITAALISVSPHLFRQAIITEVYGLHQLLFSIAIYCFFHWVLKQKTVSIYFFFLFSGLAFSNHHIYLSFFIPSFLLFTITSFQTPQKNIISLLTKSFMLLLLGLLPYLYLPLQAKNHFYFNWGDPKTIENFLLTVLRFQYFPHFDRTFSEFLEQIREYFIHLFYNFNIIFVVLSFIGIAITNIPKKIKYFLATSYLFTGPIVSLMINFKIPTKENISYLDVANTMSVFFLSSYFIIGMGFYLFLTHFKNHLYKNKIINYTLSATLALFLLYRSSETISVESKGDDFVAQELFNNLELITNNEKTLVLTNWDPFSFPSLYYKLVEKKYPNTIFIDVELLKGTWYQKSLNIWYPNIGEWFENKDFQLEDKIITARKTHNQEDIQIFHNQYNQLIRNIISNALKNNYKVIAMVEPRIYSLPTEVNQAFKIYPLPVGYQLYNENSSLVSVANLNALNFSSAITNKDKSDRLIKVIYNFYFFNLMNMTKIMAVKSKEATIQHLDFITNSFKKDPEKLQQILIFKKEMNL